MGRRIASPEFVGRGDQLAVLHDAFDRARARDPAMVLIGGDAGVGKTRLVSEFCGEVGGGSTIIASGSCVPIDDGGLPYAPVVGILRSLIRQLDHQAATGAMAALEALMPRPETAMDELSTSDPAARRGGLADTMAKLRLFDSIVSCLTATADRGPLIVMFEDLHWADSTSAELLHFLTRNLVHTSVLIIGTYRTEDLSGDHPLRGRLTEIGRHEMVAHLELEGLDREQTARLIESIIGHLPDWALVDGVWSRSQGNPFFAEELTAARHSPSLSPELRDVIMSRVDALTPDAQGLLQIVSASGAGTGHRLAAAVSPLDADALDRALSEVVDRHILVVDPERNTYGFRHALQREAVYAALLPGERERLHRRLATALIDDETLGPAAPGRRSAELALHWWAAGEWAEAYRASVESARAATLVRAFPEAFSHVLRALAAADLMPADVAPDHLPLLEEAAELAHLSGDSVRAVELAKEALTLIDPAADPIHAARVLTMLGNHSYGIGDSAAAFYAYGRAIELLPTDPPSLEMARVLAEEAGLLMVSSRLHEGEQRSHQAIEIARAVRARQVEGKALNTLGCCRSLLGYADEGIELLRAALSIAHELENPDDLNRAYGNLGGVLLDAGELEAAGALVFESVAVAEEIWGMGLEGTLTNGAEALIRLGRFDEAADVLAKVGRRGLGTCVASPSMLRMSLEIRRGDLDAADRYRILADELTEGFNDVQLRGGYHLLSAELAAERRLPEEASAEIDQALALAATTDDHQYALQMCALGVRALADLYIHGRSDGRPVDRDKLRLRGAELSEQAARLLATCADRGGDVTPHLRALAMTSEAERSRMGHPDAQLWVAAAQQWEAAREPYHHAYCLWRQGEALLAARSERSAATECLRQAAQIARQIGAANLTEQIGEVARRARIPLFDADAATGQASSVTVALGLTPREAEVLALLAVGHTDREIAETLFISKKTASVHVSNLIRKLDVPNRVEAGRIGQAHLASLQPTPR